MTFARLISSDTRAGILVAVGTALLLVPIALGLSVAAIAAGVMIGVVTVGLGLAGTATSGRGTIPITTHMVYDQGLAAGLLLSGGIFLLASEPVAAVVFGVAGLIQLVVGGITRYTATPAG
jgi:hypothetical protein